MDYTRSGTMKFDLHFHLEEGPYSLSWLQRTAQALQIANDDSQESREWMKENVDILNQRINGGCYTEEWFDLYLLKAKQIGLKEAGVVDHLYRFIEARPYYQKNIYLRDDELGSLQQYWLSRVCVEKIETYISFIESQKKKWLEQGIHLRLGIEMDYFIHCEEELAVWIQQYPWDYTIGSVHFIDGWGFDNPQTKHKFKEMNLSRLYEHFFHLVESAIASKLFNIVAHLDNLKVFGYRPNETELFPYYHKIAKALAHHQIATEVNSGLLYRYPIQEMCPSDLFLSILKVYNVKMTTSSDAHFPDDLGRYIDSSIDKLKQYGYTKVVSFYERKIIEHDIQ